MGDNANTEKCFLYGEECKETSHAKCLEIFKKLAKIVWCKDFRCLWNLDLEQGKTIKHHMDYVPLGDADKYRGICSRPEIGLSYKSYDTGTRADGTHHEVAICDVRSNKKIKGHLDWSRIMAQNKNPSIPDPIESFPPESALHNPDAS